MKSFEDHMRAGLIRLTRRSLGVGDEWGLQGSEQCFMKIQKSQNGWPVGKN